MPPFSHPHSAARDIRDLLDYLWASHAPHFLYRGQTREYPGPLLASAHRDRKLGLPFVIDATNSHGKSMRGVGRRFFDARRFSNFDDIYLAYSGEETIQNHAEVSLLWKIIHHDAMAIEIGAKGFEQAIRTSLRPELLKHFEHRLPIWQRILTAQHKAFLRINVANQFLGFQIGQTLAQHYIESSEFLDATRSPTIAAFFANYSSNTDRKQQYGAHGDAQNNIGIIYRFFAPTVNDPSPEFDYYSAPAFLDAAAVAKTLEITHSKGYTHWSPEEFVLFYLISGGVRDWMFLAMPPGSSALSRIGRQQAAFLIPDEIHAETRDRDTGRQDVSYQAIEDISSRDGVERFYFLRGHADLGDNTISEGFLWPSEEVGERAFIQLFHMMVEAEAIVRKHGRVIGAVRAPDQWYPARHDLIREQAPNLS